MLGGRGGGGILPEEEPEDYRDALNEEPKRLLQISHSSLIIIWWTIWYEGTAIVDGVPYTDKPWMPM
jgi:hypothetical protein